MQATLLDSIDKLDVALAGSSTRPLLIFKHSLTCGTSAWAHEEVETLLEEDTLAADIAIIPIQTARPVSSAVAERSGIRHESPQALLFVNGQVVWHASHHRLTRGAMEAAIAAAR